MPGQLAQDVIGSQRDISDVLTMVDVKTTPVFSMLEKETSKVDNLLFEWPTDQNEAPTENAVVEGADVTEFDNALDAYAVLGNRLQWMRRQARVGKLALVGQNQAGVKDKLAKAIAKKIIQLKRDAEIRICGDGEMVVGTGTVANKTRGIGVFVQNSAQAILPIDSNYRTPSASLSTTASASITEAIVQGVLQSQYSQTGEIKTYSTICGPTFKALFKNFTQTQTASTNVMSSIRTFNQDATTRKLVNAVDVYVGDFGTMELIPSLWLAYLNASGVTQTTISNVRAYNLDMSMWAWRSKQNPQVENAPNQGGGKSFWVDMIGGLVCRSPLGEGKFSGTT